jgi:single-stranded DNA-binding protein
MSVAKFFKHEVKSKEFIGWVSSTELITKDDGVQYMNFSIPLKQSKDDNPDWLNCKIYDPKLVDSFCDNVSKGSKVKVKGIFKTGETQDGKEYINFVINEYVLLADPRPKGMNED